MKNLFVILVISASFYFSAQIYAQQWQWQNTQIQGTNLVNVSFSLDGNYGWATSDYGDMIRTTDHGMTWFQQETVMPTVYTYKVVFPDSIHGWAMGLFDSSILYTSDGGITWSHQYENPDAELFDITFVSSYTGWIVGELSEGSGRNLILRTTDGGGSWVIQDSSNGYGFSAVSFINAQEGWVSGYSGTKHTTNGGVTWATIANRSSVGYGHLEFFEGGHGWAIGADEYYHDDRLIGTIDGGLTWSPQVYDSDTMDVILDFDFVDDITGWAVGFAGVIYHTTNAGSSWSRQNSGTTGNLISVKFTSMTEGWIAGNGGLVLHTTDGGEHWEAQAGNPMTAGYHFETVDFSDTSHGWVAGSGGVALHTTNGGNSWTLQNTGYGINFRGITAVNEQIAWAVGESDTVMQTTDGGTTWIPHIFNIGYPYPRKVTHVGVQYLWILAGTLAGGDSVYRSTDGGASWTAHYLASGDLYPMDMQFIDESNGWIDMIFGGDGSAGWIYHTTNGGNTWNLQLYSYWGINAVSFINQNIGWAISGRDSIFHTTNGGANWDGVLMPENSWGTNLQFIDELNGWFMRGWDISPSFLHTTDGGNSWLSVSSPNGNRLQNMDFVDANHGWAVGGSGAILRYNGTSTPVNEDPKPSIPKSYSLSSYPNPFNPSTTIEYALPKSAKIKLSIYNLLGQEVETLFNGSQTAGTHTISWNASAQPSGLYFAKLQSENQITSVKKLVLLK